jgi:hypothetical protein
MTSAYENIIFSARMTASFPTTAPEPSDLRANLTKSTKNGNENVTDRICYYQGCEDGKTDGKMRTNMHLMEAFVSLY